ncbi:hypothetical protein [Pseudofulvibacter geojedonensis]|uniref:DUF4350 domain-containing protein n=1 Tax=Pseudofulvibacter geojedonensis TaxID=1123758 RepID=A0ABW3HZK5_9FLAO
MKITKNIFFKFSCIVFTLLTAISCGKKKTDWRVTYRNNDKNPFGTYILYEELGTLFPNQEKIELKKNPYDYFDDQYDYETDTYKTSGNYVCIDRYMFTIDEEASEEILNFVSHGNTAFIAANAFSDTFKDSLGFDLNNEVTRYQLVNQVQNTKATLSFTNKDLEDTFKLKKNILESHFSKIDSSKSTVLGYQTINGEKQTNFIKVKHYKGYFYLHTQPISFTNFHVLNNQQYAANVLSYLPNDKLFWDPHARYRKDSDEYNKKSSLSYFLSKKELRWAFILAILSLVLFVLFNARRKQRIIPIIKPLKNTTVDFTHTIGNLYYQQNNHKDIIHRKIVFFLERIRTQYYLDTQNLNQEFIEKLSTKSGKPIGEVKLLINTIMRLNNNHLSTEDDLLRLNQLIEKFLSK